MYKQEIKILHETFRGSESWKNQCETAKNWINVAAGDNEGVIAGHNTRFSVDVNDVWASKTALNATDDIYKDMGTYPRDTTILVYWEVFTEITATSFSGALSQDITIWSRCVETT